MKKHLHLSPKKNKVNLHQSLKRSKLYLVACMAVLLGIASCDDSFSPKSPFVPELVAFVVLDNVDSIQVARLYQTYDVDLETREQLTAKTIGEAKVEVREGGNVYVFRDTTVVTGENETVRYWYSDEFTGKQNGIYRLNIEADGFEPADSQIKFPSDPQMDIRVKVNGSNQVDTIQLYSRALTPEAPGKGYNFRLEFRYLDMMKNPPELRTIEVPLDRIASTGEYAYPQVDRENYINYTQYWLRDAIARLGVPDDQLKTMEVNAYMYSIDEHLFNYYKIARGFDDPNSVRLDQPDLTNITGARGVFGAVIRDSIIGELVYRRRLK